MGSGGSQRVPYVPNGVPIRFPRLNSFKILCRLFRSNPEMIEPKSGCGCILEVFFQGQISSFLETIQALGTIKVLYYFKKTKN